MRKIILNKLFLSSILLGLSWVTAVSFLPESESLIRIEPGQINFPPTPPRHQTKPSLSTSSQLTETVSILVDDFTPQPTMGDSFWAFNRLGGGRGEIKTQPGNAEELIWGATHVTAQINSGTNTAVGVWTSLSHPIQDCTPLNFSAIFPAQIKEVYQGHITTINLHIRDGSGTVAIHLQNGESSQCPPQQTVWTSQPITLTTGAQTISLPVPDTITDVGNLNWILTGDAGDFIEVDSVTLTAVLPQQLSTAEKAFLWSYAMLLSNWDANSGLTRDRAKSQAGTFDNISASGMQAAAAAVAANLGFIAQADAKAIVTQTAVGLHNLPTDPCGSNLWPHFSTNNQILPNSEWSSIDTIIAATALLEAQEALNLNSSDTDLFLTTINWNALALSDNHISHGYWDNCERIESSNSGGWQDFGTESWLVNFGQVYATGTLADFKHTPPTFNGSGFIDELAWLLLPPPCMDRWLFNWCDYSANTSADQLAYYTGHTCYDASLRHFGLSAAEVPDRSALPASAIYQAFGIGGNILANDNANGQLQDSIITPHYAGLSASAKPNAAIDLWQWLISGGIFTPLNNVESYAISTASSCTTTSWNALKGSWNLSLQTLGWGRHLSGDSYPLYEAVTSHDSLSTAMQHMTAFQLFLPITQSGS